MTDRFMKWLMEQVGSIYVWGAQGERDFSEAWIRGKETSDKNAERAITLLNKRKAETDTSEIAAYDCSGLIVKFFIDNKLIDHDTTAAGLFSLCKEITIDDLAEGDLVFRDNGDKVHHVGVYIGNGDVVHSKGRDAGVVVEDFFDNGLSYWNKFGRYEKLKLADDMEANVYPKQMRYGGKTYVNLRTVPSALSDDTVIGKVVADEVVLVLSIENDWADVIKKNDNGYSRGYCRVTYLREM